MKCIIIEDQPPAQRILKKYIYDGTKVVKKMNCPECNSSDFVFIEGCISCKQCFWSKCS